MEFNFDMDLFKSCWFCFLNGTSRWIYPTWWYFNDLSCYISHISPFQSTYFNDDVFRCIHLVNLDCLMSIIIHNTNGVIKTNLPFLYIVQFRFAYTWFISSSEPLRMEHRFIKSAKVGIELEITDIKCNLFIVWYLFIIRMVSLLKGSGQNIKSNGIETLTWNGHMIRHIQSSK